MANKRQLKRTINYVTSELFAEAMAAVIYSGKANSKEEGDNILASIILMRDDFISRVSHPEPGIEPKKYYDVLVKDFNSAMSETVDNISNLG